MAAKHVAVSTRFFRVMRMLVTGLNAFRSLRTKVAFYSRAFFIRFGISFLLFSLFLPVSAKHFTALPSTPSIRGNCLATAHIVLKTYMNNESKVFDSASCVHVPTVLLFAVVFQS